MSIIFGIMCGYILQAASGLGSEGSWTEGELSECLLLVRQKIHILRGEDREWLGGRSCLQSSSMRSLTLLWVGGLHLCARIRA